MNKTFPDFWKTLTGSQRLELAKRAKTNVSYLYQIAAGDRNAGADLIERLMLADNRITFQMMRPPKAA